MTLVVAHLGESGLEAHSDWQLSSEGQADVPAYANGVLKLLILGRRTCVGFAGNVVSALAAIQEAEGAIVEGDIASATRILESASRDDSCEFILMTRFPNQVVSIKCGESTYGFSAWVGSQRAFESYQELRLTSRGEQLRDANAGSPSGPYGGDDKAFDFVVRDPDLPEVGVVRITVTSDDEGFHYSTSFMMVAGYFESIEIGPEPTPIPFGSEVNGAYAISICADDDAPAIAVYFALGGIGYLSAPLKLGPSVLRLPAKNQTEFLKRVSDLHGVELHATGDLATGHMAIDPMRLTD